MAKERRRRATRQEQYTSRTYAALLGRIAANVGRLRRERSWTQEEAAHRCEMSTRLYIPIEHGDSNLTMTTVARLCDGFAVDIAELWAGRGRG